MDRETENMELKPMAKIWKLKELRVLKRMYKNNSARAIGDELDRSASSVQSKAHSLGLTGTKTKKYLDSMKAAKTGTKKTVTTKHGGKRPVKSRKRIR